MPENQEQQYINYGQFETWAEQFNARNNTLKTTLEEIEALINGTAETYQSNSGDRIRAKITGMEQRFQDYFEVVDNYVKFIRNAAAAYKGVEQTNLNNADQFI